MAPPLSTYHSACENALDFVPAAIALIYEETPRIRKIDPEECPVSQAPGHGNHTALRGALAMNRKNKITIAVTAGVSLVVVVAIAAAFILPWGSSHSGWAHVPPAELFVTTQPKQEDVVGAYQLIQQTITPDGLAVLAGRPCELDLRPDGSFTAANYPRWSTAASGAVSVGEFISTTGRWRCDKLAIIYDGQECWGVVFDSQAKMVPLALRSKGAPYDLMFTYGDADEARVMTFGRKK